MERTPCADEPAKRTRCYFYRCNNANGIINLLKEIPGEYKEDGGEGEEGGEREKKRSETFSLY